MGMMPTEVGVTLTVHRFYMLHENAEHLVQNPKDDVKPGRVHIGGNYFAILSRDGSVVIRYGCEEAFAAADAIKKKREKIPHFYFEEDENDLFYCDQKRRKTEESRDIRNYDVNHCQQIKLTYEEIKKLMEVYPEIVARCRELKVCSLCMLAHNNPLGYFECRECRPFPILEDEDCGRVFSWLYSWNERDIFPPLPVNQ